MKWFGAAHDAPVYEEVAQAPTPVGEECASCDVPIAAEDDGFLVPYVGSLVRMEMAWHRDCLIYQIAGPIAL